jgi:hypothetical protein
VRARLGDHQGLSRESADSVILETPRLIKLRSPDDRYGSACGILPDCGRCKIAKTSFRT